MMKIIIVDENDEEIGLKERGSVDPKKDIVRISVLWITNSAGQILLAQRKLTKKYYPGKWGPAVGGTVEEGETYESNIYKEAEEEIGLTGYEFKMGPKYFQSHPNKRFSQSFSLTLNKPLLFFKIQEEEVEKIKWFGVEELKQDLKQIPNSYTPLIHLMLSGD